VNYVTFSGNYVTVRGYMKHTFVNEEFRYKNIIGAIEYYFRQKV